MLQCIASLLLALSTTSTFAEQSSFSSSFTSPLLQAGTEDGYYCYEDGHLHRKRVCRFFAIVIDAGSTGTRLQLYRFVHSTAAHGLPFHVDDEFYNEVKPGLSSFWKNPAGAAAGIEELIKAARDRVPEELRSRTPIALKATAGLRLLPGDSAQRILAEVRHVIHRSGFVCIGNCVEILDARFEGVYSWFTLNLLLQNFYHNRKGEEVDPDPTRSVPAFDLGGGSTQVTYWPVRDTVFTSYSEDVHEINFFDTHMHLYTHSYLGFGLQSARLGVLQSENNKEKGERNELRSACFPDKFVLDGWEHALQIWNIRGSSKYSYERCASAVASFVKSANINKLTDLSKPNKPIYLFSYFYDRALQAGLVSQAEDQKTMTLANFRQAAQKACTRSIADLSFPDRPHWLPWQCMDLTFVHALLFDGYGFEDSQSIVVAKSIRGMSVSWAQGLSYALVDEYHAKLAAEDLDDDDEDEAAQESSKSKESPSGMFNATGVEMFDSLITAISQKTVDVLNFFNLVS